MRPSAPKWPLVGSQSFDSTESKPDSRNHGIASLVVEYAMSPRTTSTISPASRATYENIRSPSFELRRRFPDAGGSGAVAQGSGLGGAVTAMRSSGVGSAGTQIEDGRVTLPSSTEWAVVR